MRLAIAQRCRQFAVLQLRHIGMRLDLKAADAGLVDVDGLKQRGIGHTRCQTVGRAEVFFLLNQIAVAAGKYSCVKPDEVESAFQAQFKVATFFRLQVGVGQQLGSRDLQCTVDLLTFRGSKAFGPLTVNRPLRCGAVQHGQLGRSGRARQGLRWRVR